MKFYSQNSIFSTAKYPLLSFPGRQECIYEKQLIEGASQRCFPGVKWNLRRLTLTEGISRNWGSSFLIVSKNFFDFLIFCMVVLTLWKERGGYSESKEPTPDPLWIVDKVVINYRYKKFFSSFDCSLLFILCFLKDLEKPYKL